MKLSKNTYYFGMLIIISFLLLFLALQTAPWSKKLFRLVCHQDPSRSFLDSNGSYLAVCSRCLGFYTMFAFNWILLFIAHPKLSKREIQFLFVFCWGLNLLDVLFNQIEFWQNTLVSRFYGGMLIAFPIAFLFYSERSLLIKRN